MNPRDQSWTHLLHKEGPDFLAWAKDQQVLSTKFDALATALSTLLHANINTAEKASYVWNAVPAVLERCNEQSTYDGFESACAYAWIYLLDRYVRTWIALERLIEKNCLPMGKFGVHALDVGTGPGPAAFAIHDFYNALTDFSDVSGNPRWRQPPVVTCFESSLNTNNFRHLLAEILFDQAQGELGSILDMCFNWGRFNEFEPTKIRKQYWQTLRNAEDEYFDHEMGEWTSEQRYLPSEANDMAQLLHRYRLFVFSNFLTTEDKIMEIEPNLVDVLQDAKPGSVMLTLGGKGDPYPEVYRHADRLARTAGFELEIHSTTVSYRASEVADRVYEEGRLFYEFLQGLSNNRADATKKVRNEFEGKEKPTIPSSEIRVYRKHGYPKNNN